MMHRTPSPLAWWRFALKQDPAETNVAAIEFGAMLAAEALKILSRHGLLYAEVMEIKSWHHEAYRPSDIREEFSTSPVVVHLESLTEMSIRKPLEDQSKLRHAYPERVRFRGTGLVHNETKKPHAIDNLVILSLSMHIEVAVEISTNVDVWLPYDLQAQEQREISDRNRPRLKAALTELSTLDVSVSSSETTKFAVTDGLHVRNHTNAFGQPVPVLPS